MPFAAKRLRIRSTQTADTQGSHDLWIRQPLVFFEQDHRLFELAYSQRALGVVLALSVVDNSVSPSETLKKGGL
jgi:hypothetical protein